MRYRAMDGHILVNSVKNRPWHSSLAKESKVLACTYHNSGDKNQDDLVSH